MTDNVITFNGVTLNDMPADRMLKDAIGKLDGVVIVGYDKDGLEYFASSYADGGDALWIIERSKKKLLEVIDD